MRPSISWRRSRARSSSGGTAAAATSSYHAVQAPGSRARANPAAENATRGLSTGSRPAGTSACPPGPLGGGEQQVEAVVVRDLSGSERQRAVAERRERELAAGASSVRDRLCERPVDDECDCRRALVHCEPGAARGIVARPDHVRQVRPMCRRRRPGAVGELVPHRGGDDLPLASWIDVDEDDAHPANLRPGNASAEGQFGAAGVSSTRAVYGIERTPVIIIPRQRLAATRKAKREERQ
jgi:hypothetical protein